MSRPVQVIKKIQNKITNYITLYKKVETHFNRLVWGKQIRIKNDICIIDISDIIKEYINLPTLKSHFSREKMRLHDLIFILLVSKTLGGDVLR